MFKCRINFHYVWISVINTLALELNQSIWNRYCITQANQASLDGEGGGGLKHSNNAALYDQNVPIINSKNFYGFFFLLRHQKLPTDCSNCRLIVQFADVTKWLHTPYPPVRRPLYTVKGTAPKLNEQNNSNILWKIIGNIFPCR